MYGIFYRFGPRFPPMSRAYDSELRKLALGIAKEMGFADFVHEGVYSMMIGPNFETVTECRLLSMAGVDATGNTVESACYSNMLWKKKSCQFIQMSINENTKDNGKILIKKRE